MKPPILIGVGIGIVILVAGLLAPLLQSSARTKAVGAQQKATLAARELDRYSVALRRAGDLAAPAEMKAKDADLKAAVQAASEPLNATSADMPRWRGRPWTWPGGVGCRRRRCRPLDRTRPACNGRSPRSKPR